MLFISRLFNEYFNIIPDVFEIFLSPLIDFRNAFRQSIHKSAGGVFAHEGIGAQSQGVHDHAPYVVQPLFAVGVGHGVLLWVVEAAREDDDAYRQVDKAVVTAVDPVTGAATISATLNHSVNDGERVDLVYPYSIVSSPYSKYNKKYTPYQDFFINQDFATLADGISGYDWRDGNGEFSVNGSNVTLKGNVELESNVAIWKLTLQNDATDPLSADVLGIYATLPMTPVCSRKYDSPTSSVNIIVPLPILNSSPQIFGPTIEFIASVSGNDYSYTHKNEVTLTGSKIYESTLTLKPLSYGLIDDEGIYYFAGESFTQAIANHPSKNTAYWYIYGGRVMNLNKIKYLKNSDGSDYISPDAVINPSATYTWGD